MTPAFRELIAPQESPCVSLYLPLLTGVPHTDDNVRRLLAMLDDAEVRLQNHGLSAKGQKQFLAPARAFAEEGLRQIAQGGCLALFLSPLMFHSVVLQKGEEESITVGQRFFLTPLFPFAVQAVHYHVLALSRNAAHFYEVADGAVKEVAIDGMPPSMEEAMKGMQPVEKSLQSHTTGSGGAPMFHGQGGAKDKKKQEEQLYVHAVMRSLESFLKEHHEPLVFAGVTELFGVCRACHHAGRLLDEYVKGNPDKLTPDELKAKADPIVQEYQKRRREVYLEEYGSLVGSGRATTDLAVLLDSAVHGKVDLLLLCEGASQWGLFNAENGRATILERFEEGAEELLGLVAQHVLLHRGRLAVFDKGAMPEGAVIAGILRL